MICKTCIDSIYSQDAPLCEESPDDVEVVREITNDLVCSDDELGLVDGDEADSVLRDHPCFPLIVEATLLSTVNTSARRSKRGTDCVCCFS